MKKKNLERKLPFNKKTVADLGNTAMDDAKGGATRACPTQVGPCYTIDLGNPICDSYVNCPCTEWYNCTPSDPTCCQ